MTYRRRAGKPRNATPADFVSWARSAARDRLATATIYARRAGELHRAQGVGRDWRPFDLPGEDRLSAAWLAGFDAPPWRSRHRFVATTHAVRTAEFMERLEDE
jgi:hypothetical protein